MPKDPSSGELAANIVRELLKIAREADPAEFKAFLLGGLMGSTLGHLPEKYFAEMMKCEPCEDPLCDCHRMQTKVMPALEVLRNDYLAQTRRSLN